MNLIDLIIPIHGDAIFLDVTLDSVRNAELDGVKIILILDRAADGAISKVENFTKKLNCTEVYLSESPGIVSALNTGISASKSQYIARLDSDDVISPIRFSTQLEFLERNPEIVLVGTQMDFIDSQGLVTGKTKYPEENDEIVKLLQFQNCIGHPSVMFRRSALDTVGGYRNPYTGAEDYDLWLRLSKVGLLHNLKESLTSYRISSTQFSNQVSSNKGIVETSVKLANLGLEVQVNSERDWPNSTELENSNLVNIKYLKERNRRKYRIFICGESIASAYSVAGRHDPFLLKAFRFSKILIKSFLISPTTSWKFFTLKIRYVNRGM